MSTNEKIAAKLGISPERKIELDKIIDKIGDDFINHLMDTGEIKVEDALISASKLATTPSEGIFLGSAITAATSGVKERIQKDPMLSILLTISGRSAKEKQRQGI